MINEIYISMAFAVCINTSNMSLATPSLAFNTIYAAVMGIVLVGWPIFVTIKFALALKKKRSALVHVKTKPQTSTVVRVYSRQDIEELKR